ncbi:hypothetical protein MKK88_11085, partial [Methylobacterium sp. E-005]|uniref:hypothetical protein n=1 Tax=Methylobacterium sp. E-005 TaxID=2836549 RepID=UPI001FB89564
KKWLQPPIQILMPSASTGHRAHPSPWPWHANPRKPPAFLQSAKVVLGRLPIPEGLPVVGTNAETRPERHVALDGVIGAARPISEGADIVFGG